MGRPAQFSKEAAIAIAMESFWEKGYDGISVSELAAAMSITRSSFYNCFKTRDNLFDDVLALYMKNTPDYFLDGLDPMAPVVPAIRQAFKNLCRDRARDPDGRGCMIIKCLAQATLAKEPSPRLVRILDAKVDRYELLLKRAASNGEIETPRDAKLMAQAITTHMIGINMICKLVRTEQELWAIAEAFLSINGLNAADTGETSVKVKPH